MYLLQVINYKEYLPNVLGASIMTSYGLNLGATTDSYNSSINPGAANSFATAAFRFGHGEIKSETQPKDRSVDKVLGLTCSL